MYDTSFCREFYAPQLPYGIFSSSSWTRPQNRLKYSKTRKNSKKSRFHQLILGAVASMLELGWRMIHHFVGNFMTYNSCMKLFPRKFDLLKIPSKNYFQERHKGAETAGEVSSDVFTLLIEYK